MDTLLSNDICNFRILRNKELIKPGVNALVSVFFKRDTYYKNFDIYTKGLQKVLRFVDDPKNNNSKRQFIYVLFVDKHIAEDKSIRSMINKTKNCVLILFEAPKYMVNDYHIDLFGTLVRFFPMFNFKPNPFNIVICIDIDLHGEDYIRLKNLMKFKHKGVTTAADVARHLYQNLPPYVFAGLLMFDQQRLDSKILMDFITNAHKIKSTGHYGKRLTTFGYGIDEIFINQTMLPLIGGFNIIIDYQIAYFLYHSKKYIMRDNMVDKTRQILSTILGSYDTPESDADKKLKMIDDYTYQIHTKTEKNDEISRRFTYIIEYFTENKIRWMEKKVSRFIYKFLKHIISATLVIKFDYKHGLTKVTPYDVIYDSDSPNNITVPESDQIKSNTFEQTDDESDLMTDDKLSIVE
jgi:hypothetical protein